MTIALIGAAQAGWDSVTNPAAPASRDGGTSDG